MLQGADPDLDRAKALGVSLFAGEAEGRLDALLRDASAGRLKPLFRRPRRLAQVIRFAPNDLDHLELILAQVRPQADRALIIVEGLYTMDRDVANLPRLSRSKSVTTLGSMVMRPIPTTSI